MNSMTGFGAASASWMDKTLRVEISGVNRKQVEVALSLPRTWAELEQPLRQKITSAVSRGRINLSVTVQSAECATLSGELVLHESAVETLKQHLQRLDELGLPCAQPSIDNLFRIGAFEMQTETTTSPDEILPILLPIADDALQAFLAMRKQEGETLRCDLLHKLNILRRIREDMIAQAATVPARYRELLMKRLTDAGIPVDLNDERIIREIALFADRCDVSEEMVRLASHFDQFEVLCSQDEPAGRPLDFLCQEIFRELNTTGSKANDAALAQLVVTAKTELEKIREQVQNIE